MRKLFILALLSAVYVVSADTLEDNMENEERRLSESNSELAKNKRNLSDERNLSDDSSDSDDDDDKVAPL